MPKPIKTLIVAVDFSEQSKTVVLQAQAMSKKFDLDVVYVYVFEDIALLDEAFEIKKKNLTEFYSRKLLKEYQLKTIDVVIVRYGRAYEEIIAVAKSFSRAMILAGHQADFMTRLFLGSTVERIALCSPLPVWIHRSREIFVPKKMLVPTDLSQESVTMVEKANSFKMLFRAKLEIFHVMATPAPILNFEAYLKIYNAVLKSESQRLASFKKRNPSIKVVKARGEVVDKIAQRAKNFDVLVLSPRTNKKSVNLFGGVTSKLIRSGETPILILP